MTDKSLESQFSDDGELNRKEAKSRLADEVGVDMGNRSGVIQLSKSLSGSS